jgi:C1A family cysteine protease
MRVVSAAVFLGLLSCAYALTITSENAADYFAFQSWMSQHGKSYGDNEVEMRFATYRDNVVRIANLNAENDGVVYSVNKFADLSPAEFKRLYLNHTPGNRGVFTDTRALSNTTVQANKVDWRDKGAITPVKDQGQCGSCWAFSAVEEIESMEFMAGRPLQVLAPQQVVSCDKGGKWGDDGCNGGWTEGAFEYVQTAGGIETEANYPYKSGASGQDGPCTFDASKVAVKIKGYTYAVPPCTSGSCTHQDETGLLTQISSAPISICVNAEPWQFYSSGVMKGKSCSGSYASQDHCVQLVGFDQSTSPSYWMVRNSWNTDWGYAGYIHLEIGTNCCGVADDAIFVTPN